MFVKSHFFTSDGVVHEPSYTEKITLPFNLSEQLSGQDSMALKVVESRHKIPQNSFTRTASSNGN